MLTVTLAQLRTNARNRADMAGSQFVSDAELNGYLNSSANELWDLLVSTVEDYGLSSSTVSLVAGTDTYSLPASFYKLRGVDLVDSNGNIIATLKPYNFRERASYSYSPTWNLAGLAYLRYHVQGNSIKFVPLPNQNQNVLLWFIPVLTQMVSDSDTLDGVNGFEEYVVVDAARKMRIKEESDTSQLDMEKAALKQRIESMAASRDQGSCELITDVNKTIPYEYWMFSRD
jgi:hypothetical protein